MNITMNAGQAAALAKLIRSQLAAYDEALDQDMPRPDDEPFTGADLDLLAPLLHPLEGDPEPKIIALPAKRGERSSGIAEASIPEAA